MARGGAPAHPSAQLVQLGEPEALRVLDQHHRGVRDVDPHLDHARRHEHLHRVVPERPHGRVALFRLHPSVHEADAKLRKHFPQTFRHRRRRPQVRPLRFLDHRINHVRLTTARAFGTNELVDLFARRVGADRRLHRAAPRGALAQLGHVQVAEHRQRERARDRRRGQEQHVGGVALFDQGGALLHAEAVLLVDYRKTESLKPHVFLDEGVRPDD